jgi:hypothetical protein
MDHSSFMTLLACLDYAEFDQAGAGRLLHASTEEWQEVATLASLHSVAPLLYYRLKKQTLAIPDEVAAIFKDAYLNNIARNIRLYDELTRVLGCFQVANIPVMVLKGAHLAELIYGNIGLRPMGDVDLLVRKDDLKKVDRELCLIGYACQERNHVILKGSHHFHYTSSKTGLTLEIHWILVSADLPFQIDMDGIWDSAESAQIAGVKCLILNAEDLLLHLCLHSAKHIQIPQLRMMTDICEVIKHHQDVIDWNQVGTRAQEWGIVRPLYIILRLSKELLGAAIPVEWLTSLKPEDFHEDYLLTAWQQLSAIGEDKGIAPTKYIMLLSHEKDLFKKLRILCVRLFPTRRSMSIIFPAAENSWRIYLYYPVRWVYLFSRYGRLIWQLIWSGPISTAAINEQNFELFEWLFPSSSTSDRDL